MFRARDTRPNRDVAIKVLPKGFASDAERLRRLEQEAKTVAALNHPNVLTPVCMAHHSSGHGSAAAVESTNVRDGKVFLFANTAVKLNSNT